VTDARAAFHHGDLRAALIASGLELSRTAGAEAIVLREATRRAGVTARAAYRHFADRDALVRAVAQAALAEMARTIERRQQGATDPVAMLHALGTGYIQFALDEPGWFDVAFFAMADMLNTTAAESAGATGRSPYQQLEDALAGLVRSGRLDPAQAPNAALVCWSGVHGFATLTSHGPLRDRPRDQVDQQAEYLVGYLVQSVVTIPPPPVA
jgi:AcrR family transcriptional regulator